MTGPRTQDLRFYTEFSTALSRKVRIPSTKVRIPSTKASYAEYSQLLRRRKNKRGTSGSKYSSWRSAENQNSFDCHFGTHHAHRPRMIVIMKKILLCCSSITHMWVHKLLKLKKKHFLFFLETLVKLTKMNTTCRACLSKKLK